MNPIYERIKQAVPLTEAMRFYGCDPGRNGMARCPFHGDDVHPSMNVRNNFYYCHTCGEHGDEAFHTYTWTVLKAPTATEDGEQKGVCSVCGYETIQPIPAGSDIGEDETPAKPAKKTNTVLLVIIGVLAVAVIAVAVILVRKVLLQKDEEDSEDDDDGNE